MNKAEKKISTFFWIILITFICNQLIYAFIRASVIISHEWKNSTFALSWLMLVVLSYVIVTIEKKHNK